MSYNGSLKSNIVDRYTFFIKSVEDGFHLNVVPAFRRNEIRGLDDWLPQSFSKANL